MNPVSRETLKRMAGKYIWWKTPAESLAMPRRVIAQIMNIGDYADVQRIANELGEDAFRDALAHAEPGQFSPRSWAYWHYRLGLAALEQMPPLPARTFRQS